MVGEIINVRYCEVLSVVDREDGDRIIVRLHPEDDGKPLNEIQYAFPLLPKMIHVKPKVGEGVLVLLSVTTNGDSQRYYIGPVISQDHKIYKDEFFMGGDTFMKGSVDKFDIAPSTKPEMIGTLPKDNDVVIRGRKNSDVQITDDDVRIKSGVKLANDRNKYDIKFNEHDPAYIKVKYHPGGLIKQSDIDKKVSDKLKSNKGFISEQDYIDAVGEAYEENGINETKQCNSTVTLVADKINLLQNNSEEKRFTTTDKDELITDDELQRALKEAYKLPYGEKLVEILSLMIDAFVKHTHPFSMLPPCAANNIPELIEKKATLLDGKQLLSDTVRIN